MSKNRDELEEALEKLSPKQRKSDNILRWDGGRFDVVDKFYRNDNPAGSEERDVTAEILSFLKKN